MAVPKEQSKQSVQELIPPPGISRIFKCSDNYARALMRQLYISKRGPDYSSLRILTDLGFGVPLPLSLVAGDEAQNALMVDTADLARWIGESPRNVRRRLAGTHSDASFPPVIHLGPSKRLVFKAELQAWLHHEGSPIGRTPERVHAHLRGESESPMASSGKSRSLSATDSKVRGQSVVEMFQKPQSSC